MKHKEVHTTCRCGKSIVLTPNGMGWMTAECECGCSMREYNGKLIVDYKNSINYPLKDFIAGEFAKRQEYASCNVVQGQNVFMEYSYNNRRIYRFVFERGRTTLVIKSFTHVLFKGIITTPHQFKEIDRGACLFSPLKT